MNINFFVLSSEGRIEMEMKWNGMRVIRYLTEFMKLVSTLICRFIRALDLLYGPIMMKNYQFSDFLHSDNIHRNGNPKNRTNRDAKHSHWYVNINMGLNRNGDNSFSLSSLTVPRFNYTLRGKLKL